MTVPTADITVVVNSRHSSWTATFDLGEGVVVWDGHWRMTRHTIVPHHLATLRTAVEQAHAEGGGTWETFDPDGHVTVTVTGEPPVVYTFTCSSHPRGEGPVAAFLAYAAAEHPLVEARIDVTRSTGSVQLDLQRALRSTPAGTHPLEVQTVDALHRTLRRACDTVAARPRTKGSVKMTLTLADRRLTARHPVRGAPADDPLQRLWQACVEERTTDRG